MLRAWSLIRRLLYPRTCIWVDVLYVAETPKAILIIFDGRRAWLPKAWIYHIKRTARRRVIASPPKAGEAISIKTSDYHWAKKFA